MLAKGQEISIPRETEEMIKVYRRYLLHQYTRSDSLRLSTLTKWLLQPLTLVLLTLCAFTVGHSADLYVAPSGVAAADGSVAMPWDLQTALSQPAAVKPGDTIWLRGGTYGSGGSTMFYSTLQGTAATPIIVRGYPNERATVNGGITSNGAYVWFWGFEITNSANTARTILEQEARSPGITMYGVGNKAINMVIHDTRHPGIGFWSSVGDGGEVYGTVFWGIGNYFGTALTKQGSAIYAQNKDGTRYIRDTISFKNFTTGFKAFTTNTYANGFHIEGNISFMNGEWDMFTVSRNLPVERLKVLSNYTYKTRDHGEVSYQFGYELETKATPTCRFISDRSASAPVVKSPSASRRNHCLTPGLYCYQVQGLTVIYRGENRFSGC